jgi:antitoxin component YwqK of YwqJK toxin-antitoxin module
MGQAGKAGPQTHRDTIKQPRDINGYPCAKGYAWFYADGRLERCSVSREIAFGEAQVQRGSIIVLLPDGKPDYVMLRRDSSIAGAECKGGGLLGPGEGAMTTFYPSGKLKQCWLAKDQVVQGVPCMNGGILGDGTGAGVKFRESGKLESCKLAKDYGGLRRGDRFVQVP